MKLFITLVSACIIIISSQNQDNFSILMSLKESAMDIIEQNQKKINTNKDGSMADKRIDKAFIAKKTFDAYVKATENEDWNVSNLKGSHDKQQLASALATFLSQARIVIAGIQPIINTDSDGSENPKGFYPAVFGRLTADNFFDKTGIKIKQTTLGKGYGARNSKYNTPDEWEKAALIKLENIYTSSEYGFGEEVSDGSNSNYRFIYPLVIKKACLSCHGDPKGEKDISGYVKEGYKVGELRGGISIILP